MRIAVTIPDEKVRNLMRFGEVKTKIEPLNRTNTEWVRRKKPKRSRRWIANA